MRAFTERFAASAASIVALTGHGPLVVTLIALASILLAPSAQARVGDIDPSYGVNGRAVIGSSDDIHPMAILNDGRIIYETADGGYRRLDVNGLPDPSFGTDGMQAWPAGYTPAFVQWQRTGQGKWVIALWREGPDGTEFAILRLGQDGTPDPTFGTDGVASIDVAADGDRDVSLVLQPDGKLVALLARWDESEPAWDQPVLVRMLPDGSLDAAFGTLGGVSVPSGYIFGPYGTVRVVLLSKGPLVVASNPVTCFDDSGVATACPPNPLAEQTQRVADLLPDGGWIASRRILDAEHALAKFHGDGTPDLSFQFPTPYDPEDVSGEVGVPGPAFEGNRLSGVYASADARYVYAWIGKGTSSTYYYPPTDAESRLYRYFADGTRSGPDASFGEGGVQVFRFSGVGGRALGVADGSTMVATRWYAYRLLGRDAPSPGVLGIGNTPAFDTSADGAATLPIIRAAGSDGEVRLRYWTADMPAGGDFATPGVDYDAVSGELVWANGDTTDKVITIPLRRDSPLVGTRTIVVNFAVLSGTTWIENDYANISVHYSRPTQGGGSSGGDSRGSAGGGGGGGGSIGWVTLLLLLPAYRRRMRCESALPVGAPMARSAA